LALISARVFAATSQADRNATAKESPGKAKEDPHYGKYQASTPAAPDGDLMTTIRPENENRDLKVESASASPDRPADKGKVLWDGKTTNPTKFTGRSTGWGALYDVRGIYASTQPAENGAKIKDEWFSHFKPKDEPRVILEINTDGNDDNTVMMGANPGVLTVKVLDAAPDGYYEITLSCTGRDGENGTVTIGSVGPLYGENSFEATVDLTGTAEGKMQISGTCQDKTPSPPKSVPVIPVDGAVASLSVEEVTFDTKAIPGCIPIYVDGTNTLYPTPHWKRGRVPGAGISFAQSPVGFVKHSTIRVTVTLRGANGYFFVRGNGEGVSFPIREAQVSNGSATIANWDAEGPLYDGIDYYNPMTIQWEYSDDDGSTWHSAGFSANQFYVTLAATQDRVYHTLAHIACRNSKGLTNRDVAFGRIWDEFKDRYVQRVDGTLLKYYANEAPAGGLFTEGLLLKADARCGAWGNFFRDTCSVQDITTTCCEVKPLDKEEDTFTIKNMAWGTKYPDGKYNYLWSEMKKLRGIPGQGVATPASKRFDNHALVKKDTVLYDPSYGGEPYATLLLWEQSAVWSFNHVTASRPNEDRLETQIP
jgi:hypothetical protein